MTMLTYAQARAKRQLHLVATDGELVESVALCGRRPTREDGRWRMTINVPLGHACKDCRRKVDG